MTTITTIPPSPQHGSQDTTPNGQTTAIQLWKIDLGDSWTLAFEKVGNIIKHFKGARYSDSAFDKEQAQLQRNDRIKEVTVEFLAAIQVALSRGAQHNDIEILDAKECLATFYTKCEEFDKAEEQLSQTLGHREQNVSLLDSLDDSLDDLLHCRREFAQILKKAAATRRDPQSTRVQALGLVMQNINEGGRLQDLQPLEPDIELCDKLVMKIINCTESPRGDKIDPTGAAPWGHVDMLQKTSHLLVTSVKEAEAMVTTLLLQVKIRIVQLLAVELRAWGRAREVHAEINEIRSRACLGDADEKLEVALQRTFQDLNYWDENLQLEMYVYMRQQRAKQMWLTALTLILSLCRWRRLYRRRKTVGPKHEEPNFLDMSGKALGDAVIKPEGLNYQVEDSAPAQTQPRNVGQRLEGLQNTGDTTFEDPVQCKEEDTLLIEVYPGEDTPKEDEQELHREEVPPAGEDQVEQAENSQHTDGIELVGETQLRDEVQNVDEAQQEEKGQSSEEVRLNEEPGLDEVTHQIEEAHRPDEKPQDKENKQRTETEQLRGKLTEVAKLSEDTRQVKEDTYHKDEEAQRQSEQNEQFTERPELVQDANLPTDSQKSKAGAERQELVWLAEGVQLPEASRQFSEEAQQNEKEIQQQREDPERLTVLYGVVHDAKLLEDRRMADEEEQLTEKGRRVEEVQALEDTQLDTEVQLPNKAEQTETQKENELIALEQDVRSDAQPELLGSFARTETGFTEPLSDVEDENDDDEVESRVGSKGSGALFDANYTQPTSRLSLEWIESMKTFSNTTLANTDPSYFLKARVVVIDTGIHADHPKIRKSWGWSAKGNQPADKPSRFRDFSERQSGDDIDGEPTAANLDIPVDEDGHGTFIAGILLNLVPGLELFVARIGKTRSSIQNDDPEHLSYKVAKAIEYAVDKWEVDIISISFGCEKSLLATQEIKKAVHKDIIILAATGNSGNSKTPPFPASESGVFKIYSCTAFAKADERTGTPWDTINSFHTLGRDIESVWPWHLGQNVGKDGWLKCKKKNNKPQPEHTCSSKCNTWTVMSGTSFATPIAAAVVAIVYQFYNSHREQIDRRRKNTADHLKTINSVRHILHSMSVRSGYNNTILYLHPPGYDTGSTFYFQTDGRNQMAKDSEEKTNVYGFTYDFFFILRLTEAINGDYGNLFYR